MDSAFVNLITGQIRSSVTKCIVLAIPSTLSNLQSVQNPLSEISNSLLSNLMPHQVFTIRYVRPGVGQRFYSFTSKFYWDYHVVQAMRDEHWKVCQVARLELRAPASGQIAAQGN